MASYVDSFYFLPSAPIRCCGNLQQQNARPDIERRLCPCNYQFERDAMQDMQAQFSHARFRDPPLNAWPQAVFHSTIAQIGDI